VSEDEASWKTMCRKCFAIKKKEEEGPKNTYKEQKHVAEFKQASKIEQAFSPTVEEEVGLLVKIAKQLSFDLGKKIEELDEPERAWVSTIYIQRRRSGLL